jgi:imidazole glycerol-phosphate synthase subunit HisH
LQVGIIDYGSGNTGSVVNAFSRLGHHALMSDDLDKLASCTHLVLPGVGSFSAAREKLEKVMSAIELRKLASGARAFLGICVGMQLLCEEGDENGLTAGYGFFKGRVSVIPDASVLPHVGWNNLQEIDTGNPLLEGISELDDFYFVHSFCLTGSDNSQISASTDHGSRFPAVARKENVYGVQFHPEKSAGAGARLLKNFLNL